MKTGTSTRRTTVSALAILSSGASLRPATAAGGPGGVVLLFIGPQPR